MSDKKLPLTNCNTWIRLAYMLLFGILLMAARLVISLVVVVQFLLVLIIGSDNENLRNLGQGLGKWVYQTVLFLTFNSEDKPFPFDEWPTVETASGYSVNSDDDEVEEVEDAEYVEAEEVADDDVPSFTADESDSETDQPQK
ncbi:MAG: DUF4389 domain-containing protein [Porticoccaceae bacterium]|nr:DUF4389 domain-containing protein [Porticoccaceae bacterium]